MVKWAPHTWSLKVSAMSTTLTVWSSTPSSPSAPSAEGFAPMSTSTAPWTTHCKPNHSNDNIYISRLLLLKWPLAKNKQPPLNTRMKTHNSSVLFFINMKQYFTFYLKFKLWKYSENQPHTFPSTSHNTPLWISLYGNESERSSSPSIIAWIFDQKLQKSNS